jgi:hypothetical protein
MATGERGSFGKRAPRLGNAAREILFQREQVDAPAAIPRLLLVHTDYLLLGMDNVFGQAHSLDIEPGKPDRKVVG